LRVDDLANRLGSALRHATQERREQLAHARARLAAASPERRVQIESHRLLALWKRLESVSPRSVLKRGFALVRDESGQPVARAKDAQSGQPIVTEFADGKIRSRVE
jgi:exodeoxyribonuclease VII large subunit